MLAAYEYLGRGTIVKEDYAEAQVRLDYTGANPGEGKTWGQTARLGVRPGLGTRDGKAAITDWQSVMSAVSRSVELSCMLTGENARTVGLHYGGISCSAVGNIWTKVREGQFDIRSDLAPLPSRIRTTHVENTAHRLKCKMQA